VVVSERRQTDPAVARDSAVQSGDMTSVRELLEAQGRRLQRSQRGGGEVLREREVREERPCAVVIPQAGERIHIRGNP
jgi:hypothetical protein